MKTIRIFLLAAFAAAFASACQTVDVTPEPSSEKVLMTFSVAPDNSDDTRTFLAPDGKSVGWKNTDELAVWDGTQVCKFSIPETVEDLSGAVDFTGNAVDGQEAYYALYPYAAEGLIFTTGDGDPYVTGVTFPEVQTATKGSYDPKAVVSVAVSKDKNFEMRNTVALAKVTIKSADIKSVQITAAENEENKKAYLAAVSKVVIREYPAVYAQSSQSKSVTLTSETAMEPGDYYIAMLPRTLEGLSVTYTKTDESVATVSSATTVDFKRATITPLGIDDSKLTFIKEEEPEEPETPAEPVEPETLTLTIDCANGQPFTEDIATSSSNYEKAERTWNLQQDGVQYPFVINCGTKGYRFVSNSIRLNEGGATRGSIMTPAIESMKLVSVYVNVTNDASDTGKEVYVSAVNNSNYDTNYLGMQAFAKNPDDVKEKTFNLTGTAANKSYYIIAKRNKTQIAKLVLTYESVTE